MKYFTLALTATLIIIFFCLFPAPADRILNIQNYLITVSGIISGIIIAYLASKLFNVKQERAERQSLISNLSSKLTHFRRLLYYVMKSSSFWEEYQQLRTFKAEFSNLSFDDIHGSASPQKEIVKKYYERIPELKISDTTADLYLAMEAIYGKLQPDETGTWVFDPNIQFTYSIAQLNLMIWPANQIWYYLDGRYVKHTEGLINDRGLSPLYKNNIPETIGSVDDKFKNIDFDRKLLASIGSEFHSIFLPRLIELTAKNQTPLPISITNLFRTMVYIFCIGAIFPLFIQCLNLSCNLNLVLTLTAVGGIILAFINLLFDFFKIMKEEITITT